MATATLNEETSASETIQPDSEPLKFTGKVKYDEGIKVIVCNDDEYERVVTIDGLKEFLVSRIKTLKEKIPMNPKLDDNLTFPSVLHLAKFSYLAYCTELLDAKQKLESDTNLKGWMLLGLVESLTNRYRSALFFRPANNHIVIAHRGTSEKIQWLTTNLGGVVKKKYVSEINSAATFVHTILNTLSDMINETKDNTISPEERIHFETFFTGHSLGAWLAQITTFTSKYLRLEGEEFIFNDQEQRLHVHCTTFDDPGCKEMLERMAADRSLKYPGKEFLPSLDTLDINNYLMEPNVVNSANLHAGTSYLIPGNSNAHGIKYIIMALRDIKDSDIRVIVDWPLLSTTIFKYFHSHKTIEFDMRIARINAFNYKQQKFLREFQVLRKISGYDIHEMSEFASTQLQKYSINEFTIGLSSGSIQNFVPFVSLLLHCHPQFNDKIAYYLSDSKGRKQFYQIQSKTKNELDSDIRFITGWPSDFKSTQVHVFTTANIRLKLIEMYQWIEADNGYKDSYTILDLNKLIIINELSFIDFLESLDDHVFVIESTTENGKINEKATDLLISIKKFINGSRKEKVKIIFVAHKDDTSLINYLTNLFAISAKVETSLRNRLTDETVTLLGEKHIQFYQSEQNAKLRDLLTNYEEILDDDEVVAVLIDDDRLTIGMYEKNFQTFEACRQQICSPIPNDCSIEVTLADGSKVALDEYSKNLMTHLFLEDAGTELIEVAESKLKRGGGDATQTFEVLCRENPKKTYYWIGPSRGYDAYFQEVYDPRLYLKRKFSKKRADDEEYTIDESDLNKFDRVELIIDEPGMGKSTSLKIISAKIDSPWIVRMNLRDNTDAIAALPLKDITITTAMQFLSKATTIDLTLPLARKLFRCALDGKTKKPIYLLFDGVDEIDEAVINVRLNKDEKSKNEGIRRFIELVKFLKEKPTFHIWLTTRWHKKTILETELKEESRYFIRLEERNQIEYLSTSWQLRLTFCRHKFEGIEEKIQNYAQDLLRDAAHILEGEILHFIGVPLQLKMLSEAFPPQLDFISSIWYGYTKQLDNVSQIYQTFIDKKFDIWLLDKNKLSIDSAIKCKPFMKEKVIEMHRIFAFRMLKAIETDKCFSLKEMKEQDEHLDTLFGVGLLTSEGSGDDGVIKYNFVHRTFAEFFVADLLVNCIRHPATIPYPMGIDAFVNFLPSWLHFGNKLNQSILHEMMGKLQESDPGYVSSFRQYFSNVQFFHRLIRYRAYHPNFFFMLMGPINMSKFLLQILFEQNYEELLSLKYNSELNGECSLVEEAYHELIESTFSIKSMVALSMVLEAIPVPDDFSINFYCPPTYFFIANKEQTFCGFFTARSCRLCQCLFENENWFKNLGPQSFISKDYYITRRFRSVDARLEDTCTMLSQSNAKLLELLNASEQIESKIENEEFPWKWTLMAYTLHLWRCFSNWKLVLTETYDNAPSGSEMLQSIMKKGFRHRE